MFDDDDEYNVNPQKAAEEKLLKEAEEAEKKPKKVAKKKKKSVFQATQDANPYANDTKGAASEAPNADNNVMSEEDIRQS